MVKKEVNGKLTSGESPWMVVNVYTWTEERNDIPKSVVEARRRVEMATIFGSEALRWKEGEGRKEFRERCG